MNEYANVNANTHANPSGSGMDAMAGLSGRNIDFLEYAKNTPSAVSLSSYKTLELNSDLFRLQPWPTFISPGVKESFREAGVRIFDLVKRIPRRVFDNDRNRISQYYNLPKSVVDISMSGVTDAHVDRLVARGDFILTAAGLKCLEYNVSSNLGGWQVPVWEKHYLDTPVVTDFFEQQGVRPGNENLLSIFLEHAVESALAADPSLRELNIVFAADGLKDGSHDDPAQFLCQLYRELLDTRYPELDGRLVVGSFAPLELKNNRLYHSGRRVHVVVEKMNGVVPPAVFQAFNAGNLCLFNGTATSLMSAKVNLALLSDHQTTAVFNDEETAVIDKYVPWSRRVCEGVTRYKGETIDLMPFIYSNRRNLVLKTSFGYGGNDIFIGDKVPQEEWERRVHTALQQKNWLIQERLEGLTGMYLDEDGHYDEHDMVWGFFVFGSRYGGAWVRVMPRKNSKGVINCHQGASVSGIFEVDR
jgi:hypothetical protein